MILRVEAELKAALRRAAEEDDRTSSAFAERLLRDGLVRLGYLKKKTKGRA